jgi:DNA-binding SARP family transcriptional activator
MVSRLAPSPAELRLLADLVADPGGAAALLPASSALPARSARSLAGMRVLELSGDPGAFSARLRAQPQAVTRPTGDGRAGLRIGVLGALTINGRPAALLPAQSQLIVALALHGDAGLSNGQLCGLLGTDPGHQRPADSLRQLIVRTRRQLGRADDGLEWIEHRGGGRYALHRAATVDWTEFEAITSLAIAMRDADKLAAAMTMVRGQPFAGCLYWWLDLAMVERVRARIVDTAETLGKLALDAANPAQAARAARTGLIADEAAERLWRVLMRAEHAAGNMAGVRETWSRCRRAIADISADGQPESATTALYQQLVSR